MVVFTGHYALGVLKEIILTCIWILVYAIMRAAGNKFLTQNIFYSKIVMFLFQVKSAFMDRHHVCQYVIRIHCS